MIDLLWIFLVLFSSLGIFSIWLGYVFEKIEELKKHEQETASDL